MSAILHLEGGLLFLDCSLMKSPKTLLSVLFSFVTYLKSEFGQGCGHSVLLQDLPVSLFCPCRYLKSID